MVARVAVYIMVKHRRSMMCGKAMASGIRKAGDEPTIVDHYRYSGPRDFDACAFYGYVPDLQKIMEDYRAAGKPAVYIDLGYWKREGTDGYHKLAVNARHPAAYFQRYKHDDSRARSLGIVLAPWRTGGRHILLAGMGAKAAVIAEHQEFERFERDAIAMLRQHTDRPIVYRPKPSCQESGPIDGTVFSPKTESLADVLKNCHAVVTYHSNVAVEALVAGVPTFAWQGVAAPLSLQDLSNIEAPLYPDDRNGWLNDVSYCQWSLSEIRDGLAWRHLKEEALIHANAHT